MKKKIFYCIAALGCVLMFSSCAVSAFRAAEVRTANFTGEIIHIPLTADLHVNSTKVIGVYREEFVPATGRRANPARQWEMFLKRTMPLAVADAVQRVGADKLIQPIFTVEAVGNDVTITVTGYPATFRNFRSATVDDIELLNLGREKNPSVIIRQE